MAGGPTVWRASSTASSLNRGRFDGEHARLFEAYMDDGGAGIIMAAQPPLGRVLPAADALRSDWILPYDDVRAILEQTPFIAVKDCFCRVERALAGSPCRFPLHVCLSLRQERPGGADVEVISTQQALGVLQAAETAGLVHTVSNVRGGWEWLCNCCSCCCPALRAFKERRIETAVVRNYRAIVDQDACAGCALCKERCRWGRSRCRTTSLACRPDRVWAVGSARRAVRSRRCGCALAGGRYRPSAQRPRGLGAGAAAPAKRRLTETRRLAPWRSPPPENGNLPGEYCTSLNLLRVSDPDANEVAAALQLSIGLCVRQLRQAQVRGDLTLPEASALKRLDRGGPASVTELAKAEQISVQSIGTTLGALEARGLVERRSHPSDGRSSVLSITQSGTRVLGDRHNGRVEQLAKALSTGFSPAELRQLMAAAPLIERLAQSL